MNAPVGHDDKKMNLCTGSQLPFTKWGWCTKAGSSSTIWERRFSYAGLPCSRLSSRFHLRARATCTGSTHALALRVHSMADWMIARRLSISLFDSHSETYCRAMNAAQQK